MSYKLILYIYCISLMITMSGCFLFEKNIDNISLTNDSLIYTYDSIKNNYNNIQDSSCLFKLEYLERMIEQGDITRSELLDDIKDLMKKNNKLQQQLNTRKSTIKTVYKKSEVNIINANKIDSLNQIILNSGIKNVERNKVKNIKDKSKDKNKEKVKTTTKKGSGWIAFAVVIILGILFLFLFRKNQG